MASRVQRELAFLLTGRDVSASRAMQNVDRRISGLERHAGKAASNIGRNIERGFVVGSIAAVGAIGYSVQAAVDWESAFAGVRKTLDATPEQLTAVADGIRAMSREMPVTATELAAIAEAGGQMGVKADDILEFTRTVAMLGATTNVSTDAAATALGQLQNVIGLTSDEYDNFAATLVDLGNKGNSTEAQILEVTRRAGGAAHLLGIAKDATVGWAAAAANLGMQQELAGSSLQRFFMTFQSNMNTTDGTVAEMAHIAGMGGKAFKKAFEKDATGAMTKFLKGLGKLPRDARLKEIQGLFGKGTGISRLVIGLSDSFDDNLKPALDDSRTAWEQNTAATEEYRKRAETTASQLEVFKNNVNDAAVTIGSELLPQLAELSGEGTEWLQEHQPEIKQFAKDLADGIRDAVGYAKSLDWDAIGDALKAGADAAKTLVDTFMGLPAPIQQLLVGGFVANKVTGGVLTDVAGGAIGAAFKTVLTRMAITAAVVNVTGGTVTGGPGGVGAGGKGTGLVGTVAAFGAAGVGSQIGNSVLTEATDWLSGLLPDNTELRTEFKKDMGIWIDSVLPTPGSIQKHFENVLGLTGNGPKFEQHRRTTPPAGTRGPLTGGPSSFAEAARRDEKQTRAIADSKLAVVDAISRAGDTFDRGSVNVAAVTRSGTSGITGATNTGSSRIVGAIQANKPSISVVTNVSVTPAQIQKATHTQTTYGPGNGSAGGGNQSRNRNWAS